MSITQPKRLFREKFGREPGPEDPLFFNLVSSVPEFLNAESQDETWRALVQAAGESGMDPALVYAMKQNGPDRYRAQHAVSDRFRHPRME